MRLMAGVELSLEAFSFGRVDDKSSPIVGTEQEGNVGKQNRLCDAINGGGSEGVGSSSPGERTISPKNQQEEHQQLSLSEYGLFDDLRYDMFSPPIQACLEEINSRNVPPSRVEEVEPARVKPCLISLSALTLLRKYGSGFKRQRGEKPIDGETSTKMASRGLSVEDVFRVAGARFIQYSSRINDLPSINKEPLGLYLTDEETGDVELAELLLAAAEKVGHGQFEHANMLLRQCDHLSSKEGNAVQRIVYYFSEALGEKIDRERGGIETKKQTCDMEKVMMSPNRISLACHGGIPFCQVMQFAGIQAIVDSVSDATKVHVIDLGINFGVHWTGLMQALVAHPIQLLTITAVGRNSRELIEDTGKRLTSFADSVNLPFSFKIVMIPEMLEVNEGMLEIDPEETVVISAQYVLRTMLGQQNQLEALMGVLKSINPRLLVVIEVEANHNSPVFARRFVEALFYFSTYFDCFEACMERDDPNRTVIESAYFGAGSRNIVGAEGEGRNIRSVKLDVWRAFFARYGMVEAGLSMSSLYQANLVLDKFACGGSCSLDMNGESLIVGWKGTPIHSLSAWKFK